MPSVHDLALLSAAAYDDEPRVDGWVSERSFPERAGVIERVLRPWGFSAVLFRRGAERVLAFRGTDDVFDLDDDLRIAASLSPACVLQMSIGCGLVSLPPQALLALEALKQSGNEPLYLTGHSLGGALATLLGAASGHPVVSFNAPGLAFLRTGLGRTLYWERREDPRMLHVRSRHDPVSALTPTNPGAYRVLDVACGFRAPALPDPESSLMTMGWSGVGYAAQVLVAAGRTVECHHSMASLLAAVADEPGFRLDLGWSSPVEKRGTKR